MAMKTRSRTKDECYVLWRPLNNREYYVVRGECYYFFLHLHRSLGGYKWQVETEWILANGTWVEWKRRWDQCLHFNSKSGYLRRVSRLEILLVCGSFP